MGQERFVPWRYCADIATGMFESDGGRSIRAFRSNPCFPDVLYCAEGLVGRTLRQSVPPAMAVQGTTAS